MIDADHVIALCLGAVALVVRFLDGDGAALGDAGEDGGVGVVVDGELVDVAKVVLDEGDDAGTDEGRGDGAEDEGVGAVVGFWLEGGEGDLGSR